MCQPRLHFYDCVPKLRVRAIELPDFFAGRCHLPQRARHAGCRGYDINRLLLRKTKQSSELRGNGPHFLQCNQLEGADVRDRNIALQVQRNVCQQIAKQWARDQGACQNICNSLHVPRRKFQHSLTEVRRPFTPTLAGEHQENLLACFEIPQQRRFVHADKGTGNSDGQMRLASTCPANQDGMR